MSGDTMTRYGTIQNQRAPEQLGGMRGDEKEPPSGETPPGEHNGWLNFDNLGKDTSWSSTSTLDSETIYLVVSGKQFCISKSALLTFPQTRLGQLALRHSDGHHKLEYVFDRNSKIMASVLDLYRTGELHLPTNLCCVSIRRELRYWGIPDELISECCYGRYLEAMRQIDIVDQLDKVMVKTRAQLNKEQDKYKDFIWKAMESHQASLSSVVWLSVYLSFIGLSILVVCLSTMRRYRVQRKNDDGDNSHDTILDNLLSSDLNTPLMVLDTIGLVFFTIEPCVRLIVTPDRAQHAKQFLTVLDFLLAFNHWTCFTMEQAGSLLSHHRYMRYTHAILRSLLSFRVLRIFHVARRCVKMKAMLLTLRSSIGEILLLFLGVSIAVIIFATSIYYVEMMEGEDNFLNIPQAIWWAIITMTTVGYGDYYPVSVSGYIVGTLCALSGLLLLSMPIAIIANNFTTFSHGIGARDQREKRRELLRDILPSNNHHLSAANNKDAREFDDQGDDPFWSAAYALNKMKTGNVSDQDEIDYTNSRIGFRYSNAPPPPPPPRRGGADFWNDMKRRSSDGDVLMKRSAGKSGTELISASSLIKPALSERGLYADHPSRRINTNMNVPWMKSSQSLPRRSNSNIHNVSSKNYWSRKNNNNTILDCANNHSYPSSKGSGHCSCHYRVSREGHAQHARHGGPSDQQTKCKLCSNTPPMKEFSISPNPQRSRNSNTPPMKEFSIPSNPQRSRNDHCEKSRKRKYRRRRKTHGSLSSLISSPGRVWTDMQDCIGSRSHINGAKT